EQVKCVFENSNEMQKCYTADGNFGCLGINSCITYVSGEKGKKLEWKSSCESYNYTIIDGNAKYVYFKCKIEEPIFDEQEQDSNENDSFNEETIEEHAEFKYISESNETLSEFYQSEIVYGIDEYGKTKPMYCDYDTSKDGISIIIKKNGHYDNTQTVTKLNEYLNTVDNIKNISNKGIKKFTGSSVTEFDRFIEDLILNDNVGFAIIVGNDLPVTTITDHKAMLNLSANDNLYSIVGREPNGCKDIALSYVFAPFIYEIDEKNEFINGVFNNFIRYHKNLEETYNNFNSKALFINWDNNLSNTIGHPIGFSNDRVSNYLFYDYEYTLNSDLLNLNEKLRDSPFFLNYKVHGSPSSLGIGFLESPISEISHDTIYTSPNEVLNYYEQNQNSLSLFIDVAGACSQDVLYVRNDESFCCWPQTWLKTGIWNFMHVAGDTDNIGYSFGKNLIDERIIGLAYKKTHHSQGMFYGDILAIMPPSDNSNQKIELSESQIENDKEGDFLICKDSCRLDGKCYPFGYRIADKFCSNTGSFINQLNEGNYCENNFECSSNLCIDNNCIEQKLLQKVINLFKRLFN
ncbi:MAG: hypothetical protein ACOC3Z_02300, partial [Nanoarchaeota archaeon]